MHIEFILLAQRNYIPQIFVVFAKKFKTTRLLTIRRTYISDGIEVTQSMMQTAIQTNEKQCLLTACYDRGHVRWPRVQ